MQDFPEIKGTDYVATGILDVQYRDQAVATLYSGEKEPSNKFEGCAWNDLKNNQLKYWNGKKWEVVLDYGKVYIFSLSVSSGYQPLNSNLTAFGKIAVPASGMGVLSQPSVPLSYYWLNSLQTSADIVNNLGLKDLAYRDEITTQRIEDDSVSKAKLSDSIKTEPVFVTGDTIPSFAPGTKKGCVKMSTNSNIVYTVGTSTSNSTYKGTTYRNLFQKLWSRSDLRIFTASGVNTGKSKDWETDWNANKRLELPHIDLPSDSFNSIGYDSIGESFTYTIPRNGYYKVGIVGGGSGSGIIYSSTNSDGGLAQGSSGGAFLATMNLFKGDVITASVGKGGGPENPNSYGGWFSSEAGGTSTFWLNGNVVAVCGGGGALQVYGKNHHDFDAHPGEGGSATITDYGKSRCLSYNVYTGNKGSWNKGKGSYPYCQTPIASEGFDNYGAGGAVAKYGKNSGGNVTSGMQGYFSVEFISPAEYHSTDQNIKSALDNIYKSLSFFIKY